MLKLQVNLFRRIIFIVCFILLLSIKLFSYELSYDLFYECSHTNKKSKSFNFINLKNGVPEYLELKILDDENTKHGIISVQEDKNVTVILKTLDDFQEMYVYNGFNDSLKYVQIKDKLGIKKTIDIEIRIPYLLKNKNTPSSIIQLGALSSDMLFYTILDFRSGYININEEEYFIGLVNHFLDYSDMSKTKFYIDVNRDGKFSGKDSLDFHGNVIKEINKAEDSFFMGDRFYQIDSISKNGFFIEISETKIREKYAVGFLIPKFEFINEKSETQSIYDYLNEVTLIYWWAAGCSAAQKCLPVINSLYNKYKDNTNFSFLSFLPDSSSYVDEIMIDNNFDFTNYSKNSNLKTIFGESYPQTIILDESGIIKYIKEGYAITDIDTDKIEDDINYLQLDKIINGLLTK